MPPLFRKIDCLNLRVGDLEAALRFYGERLGHPLVWRTERAAGLRMPDSPAELVLHTDELPTETDLMVESVPEAVEAFVSAGGRLVSGPFEIRIGLCAIVEDPWRNQLVMLDASKGLLHVDADKNVVG
jgi:catechol 2,3-dioxygenase-like lactoylglutathione lyase family enzyme